MILSYVLSHCIIHTCIINSLVRCGILRNDNDNNTTTINSESYSLFQFARCKPAVYVHVDIDTFNGPLILQTTQKQKAPLVT